jgi:hypothetical protein
VAMAVSGVCSGCAEPVTGARFASEVYTGYDGHVLAMTRPREKRIIDVTATADAGGPCGVEIGGASVMTCSMSSGPQWKSPT